MAEVKNADIVTTQLVGVRAFGEMYNDMVKALSFHTQAVCRVLGDIALATARARRLRMQCPDIYGPKDGVVRTIFGYDNLLSQQKDIEAIIISLKNGDEFETHIDMAMDIISKWSRWINENEPLGLFHNKPKMQSDGTESQYAASGTE